jgi:serine/threonine protein kinase
MENIFVSRDENNEILLKVGDFGFAKNIPIGTKTTTYLGSPLTMAPEVLK